VTLSPRTYIFLLKNHPPLFITADALCARDSGALDYVALVWEAGSHKFAEPVRRAETARRYRSNETFDGGLRNTFRPKNTSTNSLEAA